MYVSCQVPSGKGENNFAFDGEVQDKQFAKEVPVWQYWNFEQKKKVVDFLHLEWLDMMSNCTTIASQDGQFGRFNTENTQVIKENIILTMDE